MNNDGDKKTSSFTVSIPANCFLWIVARTNSDADGLNFTVQQTSYPYYDASSNARYDRWYSSDGESTRSDKNPLETDKHLFCYYVWGNGGTYKITPSRACYIYFVAVLNHASLAVEFPESEKTLNVGDTYKNIPYMFWTNYRVYPEKDAMDLNPGDYYGNPAPYFDDESVVYTSDNETVAKVDSKTGEVTAVGAGKATITATAMKGSAIGGGSKGNRSFQLEEACSGSYEITVKAPSNLITHTNSKGDAANIWKKIELKNGNDTKMNLYLGGWKYQSTGTDITNVSNTSNGYYGNDETKVLTDSWGAANVYHVGQRTPKEYQSAPFTAYDNGTFSLIEMNNSGNRNAKCEFLYKNKLLAGDYVIDFKERLDERETKAGSADETDGKGNPFTVPCYGSFIKIEPECNGVATLYLIQNGTIDYNAGDGDSDPWGNLLLETIGWRPVYIVDETGTRLPSEDVTAVTKQCCLVSREDETTDVYRKPTDEEKKQGKNDPILVYGKDGNPITYKEAVTTYVDDNTTDADGNVKPIYEIHKSVFDQYWDRRGNAEIVLDPDITGDGWVVISKAYVKYQIKVKAGKSYYVFANKSAIGYCGSAFLYDDAPTGEYHIYDDGTIDENLKNALENNESVTAKKITVHNKNGFHKGWNSICLPFSITESKMRGIFGKITTTTGSGWFQKTETTTKEDYEVVIFNGCTEETDKDGNKTDKVHFFHHVYQDIIAGYPYMIHIPEGADIIGANTFEVNNVTIEKANLENLPTISTSRQYMPAGSGFEGHAEIDDFTFTGIYEPTLIPRGSYCVVSGGIQIYDAVELPGYRAYLDPSYKKNGTSGYDIKRITAANLNEMSYVWDEANPIKSIFADEMPDNGFSAPSDVYSASGVLVRKNSTSLEGLPKGIYIVDGKKYFVK